MGTTTENNVFMKFKDISGNVTVTYPITKKDNVMGLGDAIRNQSVTTTGTSTIYEATVSGITELTSGISFVMIPHLTSAAPSPKLNVNGLGEKFIRRRVSGSTTTTYSAKTSDDWLSAGKPIRVMYDGTQWIADMPIPYAGDFMGTLAINNGGTGATTAAQARTNLGIETTDGTVISGNADYAEVGEWVDGNPDAEDRIGYFVCVDNTTAKMTMRKATETDDVKGVTVTAPAFSGNCSNDKFDSGGNLIAKYSFVAVMGIVSVIDNGTCTVNGRCMPNANGTASPVSGDYGYQIIDRVDETHVLIAVEPGADFQYKLSTEVADKASKSTVNDVSDIANSALPKSGGTMTGALAMGGNKITGLGAPTDSADAATKGYVDGKRFTATATIITTWSGSGPYTQAVSVSGILATDTPHIMPVYSTTNSTAITQKEAWACVSKAETSANTITFTCFEEKPTTNIPIQIEVMR